MFLGIDIGTSGVKAVLLGADGTLAAQADAPLALSRPRVAVLREQGVNSHVEMAYAFTQAGFDAFDMWTAQSLGKMPMEPYSSFVVTNGLRGKRLGVLKEATGRARDRLFLYTHYVALISEGPARASPKP